MKKLLSLACLSLTAVASMAQTPTDESIRTLFSVMKVESVIGTMQNALEPAMRQGMMQATEGREPTPVQKKVLERFPQKMGEFMRTELSWAKMEPIQIRIYRESFDQAEIDGMIEFYRSPIGQSFVSKMPVVTQKAMLEMQAYMQQIMPKMQAVMQELTAEVRAAK